MLSVLTGVGHGCHVAASYGQRGIATRPYGLGHRNPASSLILAANRHTAAIVSDNYHSRPEAHLLCSVPELVWGTAAYSTSISEDLHPASPRKRGTRSTTQYTNPTCSPQVSLPSRLLLIRTPSEREPPHAEQESQRAMIAQRIERWRSQEQTTAMTAPSPMPTVAAACGSN